METTRTILAAVDGSEASENAIRCAGKLAKLLEARVLLFHVIETEKVSYWLFVDTHFVKEREKATARIMERAQDILSATGVPYSAETKEPDKATYLEIVAVLERDPSIVALVIGDRGLGPKGQRVLGVEGRPTLGSTTDRLIHEVSKRGIPVPVVVVPAAGCRDASP